jgi:hypothetical protein
VGPDDLRPPLRQDDRSTLYPPAVVRIGPGGHDRNVDLTLR